MDNVTSDLKKIFSCENLETEVCKNGMEDYFKKFKKEIKDFLEKSKKSKNKKKETEEFKNSDTCNNLQKFVNFINKQLPVDERYGKICDAAKLLPKCVLDENGKKRGKISSKASIKKVSNDIERWANTLSYIGKILYDRKTHLIYIQEKIESVNEENNYKHINKGKWEDISSEFQRSGINELKLIAEEIDKNITDNSADKADKYRKLLSKWGKNKTIENIIKNFKEYSQMPKN